MVPNRFRILLALLLAPSLLMAAQSDRQSQGEVAASFLQVTPGVRAAALGGNQAASHGQLESVFSNPAGLSSLTTPQLWFSHNQAFLETSYETLGFGLPAKKQTFAFIGQYVNDGSSERVGIDASGDPVQGLGSFRPATVLGQVSWARQLHARFAMGVSLKGWREELDQTTSSGWAGDAGILARELLPRLDLGLALRHMGPAVDGYDLPTTWALGGAYRLPTFKAIQKTALFSELEGASHQSPVVRVGLELQQEGFWLRGGFQNLSSDTLEALSQFTFGAGLRVKGWKLDYAWVPVGELGDQHRFGLTIGFGQTEEERAQSARQLDSAMEARMKAYAARHLQAGQEALAQNNLEQAVQEFSQATTWDPKNQAAHEQLTAAQSQLQLQQADHFYEQGQVASRRGQWLEAVYNWQQAVVLNPKHSRAAAALSAAKSNRKLPQKSGSSREDKLYDKGVAAYLDGRYDDAINSWQALAKINPDRAQLQEYIAKAQSKKYEGELKLLKQQRPTSTEEVEMLSQQAYTLYTLGQVDSAVATWEKITVLDPNNQDAKWALKEARAKKDSKKGNSTVDRSRIVEELNTEAFKNYGEGNLANAVAIWRRALVLEAGNLKIRNNLKRAESELAAQSLGR